MKTLGVLYKDKSSVFIKRPFRRESLYNSYREFSATGLRHGVKVVVARPEWYKKGKFIFCWDLLKNKAEKNVPVDFVFDRCVGNSSKTYHLAMKKLRSGIKKRILNQQPMEDICTDKYLTYLLFKKYMPRTFLSKKGLKKIKSDLVIVKPRYGSKGKNIAILKKISVRKLKRDYILQEFIDTSKGIKGVSKKTHDLRLVVLNGRIIDVYLRTPTKGLVSNVSLGGIEIHIPASKVPAGVKKLLRIIDRKLSAFMPRFYSADFLVDAEQRPWIVELNSHPGLEIEKKYKKCYLRVYRNLILEIRKNLEDS